jgi:hypothetical protein
MNPLEGFWAAPLYDAQLQLISRRESKKSPEDAYQETDKYSVCAMLLCPW